MPDRPRPNVSAPSPISASPISASPRLRHGRNGTAPGLRLLAGAASLVLLLVGCGDSDDESTDGTTTPAAAAVDDVTPDGSATADPTTPTEASPSADPTAAADITPACDRFTPAELEAALGPAFGDGSPDDDGQVCTWEADPSNQASLTVRPSGAMDAEMQCDTMATANSERLEIGSDPAVFEGRQIFVCGPNGTFNLLVTVSLPEEEMRTALVDLATLGADR